LSCVGVSPAAQPFLAVLLRQIFSDRPIVVVTDGLKTQESFQQDIETWLRFSEEEFKVRGSKFKVGESAGDSIPHSALRTPHFYPAWEILPHESKLPHADIISERLETLVALSKNSALRTPHSALIVANIVALLQKTFPAGAIASRTRALKRGDRIEPLDLVEWLEEQGYEPEAQ